MNAPTEMPAPLNFTDNAASKVKELIAEEGNPELKLRVFVTGGGCSGFQYGFTFDEVTNEDDTVMEKNGVSLLIDPDELPVPGWCRNRLHRRAWKVRNS
jgi:iron-sulfur cluster insertion protein